MGSEMCIRDRARNYVSARNHSTENLPDPLSAAAAAATLAHPGEVQAAAAAPSHSHPSRSTARLPFEDDDDEWGGPPAPVEQPAALPVEADPVDPLPAKRLSQTTPLGAAARLALVPVLAAYREVDNARPPDQPLRGPGAGEAPPKPAATMATTWPPAGLPPKPAG